MMKSWLSTGLVVIAMMSFSWIALSAVPSVNQYMIEKRPTAKEPAPNQYSVKATDTVKVKKPPFSHYTLRNALKPNAVYQIPPFEYTNQLPKIGKWMVAVSKYKGKTVYVPSHWLNMKNSSGKYVIEPINYLFVVYANNEKQAINSLKKALVKAGFNMKWSGDEYHSGNYHAYFGDTRVSQLKRKDGVFITFSNDTWLDQNDHFRVMGPYKTTINNKTAFIFASSVSEESVWDEKLNDGHFYVSFSNARQNLAFGLIRSGNPTYYVVSNNILNTPNESTEDHDGRIFVTVFK